jgi:uracil-DNA glycosylase
MNCTRCRRKLKREPTYIGGSPFGPTCAAAIVGARPKRQAARKVHADERQQELALEVRT